MNISRIGALSFLLAMVAFGTSSFAFDSSPLSPGLQLIGWGNKNYGSSGESSGGESYGGSQSNSGGDNYNGGDNYGSGKRHKSYGGNQEGGWGKKKWGGYGGNQGNSSGGGSNSSGNSGSSSSSSSGSGTHQPSAACLARCHEDCRQDAIVNHQFKIDPSCIANCNPRCG